MAKLMGAGLLHSSTPPAPRSEEAPSRVPNGPSEISKSVSHFMSRHFMHEGTRETDHNASVYSGRQGASDIAQGTTPGSVVYNDGYTSNICDPDTSSQPPWSAIRGANQSQKEDEAASLYLSNERLQRKVQVVSFSAKGPRNQGTVSAKKKQVGRALPLQTKKDEKAHDDLNASGTTGIFAGPTKQGQENPTVKPPLPSQPKRVQPYPILSQVDENGSPLPLKTAERCGQALCSSSSESEDDDSEFASEVPTYVPSFQEPEPVEKQDAEQLDNRKAKRIRILSPDISTSPGLQAGLIDAMGAQQQSVSLKKRDLFKAREKKTVNLGGRKVQISSPAPPPSVKRKRLVSSESEQHEPSSIDAEEDISEHGGSNTQSIEDESVTLVEPDNLLNPAGIQTNWQKALRASHQSTLDILFDISQRLVQHMVTEEESIKRILTTYQTGCTRVIEQLVQTHQDYFKQYSGGNGEPTLAKVAAKCEEMRKQIEKGRSGGGGSGEP
ncbi:hypothetical protein KEM55_004717, partial [Ascosphaera atra]